MQFCPKQQDGMFNFEQFHCPLSKSLCCIVGEGDYGGFVCNTLHLQVNENISFGESRDRGWNNS